jgi:hypothetical protein
MTDKTPRFGSIEAACKMVGGDKPISASTYYRGVKAGRYTRPKRVAPNVSRVDLDDLAARLREGAREAALMASP